MTVRRILETLKCERVYRRSYQSREEAIRDLFQYIEIKRYY